MGVKGNGKWEVPKNIRQVGEGGKEKKIYLEDYAVTYMHQVKEAALLGEMVRMGGIRYYFVDGAIELEKGVFDEGSWNKVYETVKEKFPGREVVGWYLQEDGLPQSLSEEGKKLYKQYFHDKEALVVVYDEAEKEEGVYLTLDGFLRRQKGYYIYYEKNQQMQDYMVEKNQGKSVEKEAVVSDKAIQNFRKIIDNKKVRSEKAKADTEEKPKEKPKLSFSWKEKQTKPSRFLYAASSFMVLTILIIGVTMVNNYDKMKKMEETMAQMTGSSLAVNGNAGEEESESQGLKKTVIDVRTGETETELLEGILSESEMGTENGSDVSAMSQMEEEIDLAAAEEDGLSADAKEEEGLSAGIDAGKETGELPANGSGQTGTDTLPAGGDNKTGTDALSVNGNGQTGTGTLSADGDSQTGTGELSADGDGQTGTDTLSADGSGQTGTDDLLADAGGETSGKTEEAKDASAAVHASNASYTIKIGDTLADVCQMYYGSLDKLQDICELNGIEDANQIMPGQKILLP